MFLSSILSLIQLVDCMAQAQRPAELLTTAQQPSVEVIPGMLKKAEEPHEESAKDENASFMLEMSKDKVKRNIHWKHRNTGTSLAREES